MVGKCLREVVDLALKFTKTNLHSSLYRILMSQGAVVCKMWVFMGFLFLFSRDYWARCWRAGRAKWWQLWWSALDEFMEYVARAVLSVTNQVVPTPYGNPGKKNAAKLWCAAMARTCDTRCGLQNDWWTHCSEECTFRPHCLLVGSSNCDMTAEVAMSFGCGRLATCGNYNRIDCLAQDLSSGSKFVLKPGAPQQIVVSQFDPSCFELLLGRRVRVYWCCFFCKCFFSSRVIIFNSWKVGVKGFHICDHPVMTTNVHKPSHTFWYDWNLSMATESQRHRVTGWT